MEAVRGHFRPEFVNRVDEYIVFDPLDFNQVRKIVQQQVERVRSRLKDRKIGLRVDESAIQMLCEAGYDPSFGARPVKRAVQHLLETSIPTLFGQGSQWDEGVKESKPNAEGLIKVHPQEDLLYKADDLLLNGTELTIDAWR